MHFNFKLNKYVVIVSPSHMFLLAIFSLVCDIWIASVVKPRRTGSLFSYQWLFPNPVAGRWSFCLILTHGVSGELCASTWELVWNSKLVHLLHDICSLGTNTGPWGKISLFMLLYGRELAQIVAQDNTNKISIFALLNFHGSTLLLTLSQHLHHGHQNGENYILVLKSF